MKIKARRKDRAADHDADRQDQNGKEARPARFDTDSYRAADWSVCFNALSLFTGDADKSCASAEAQASGNNLSAVRFAAGNYARFRLALMH